MTTPILQEVASFLHWLEQREDVPGEVVGRAADLLDLVRAHEVTWSWEEQRSSRSSRRDGCARGST